MSWGRIIGLVIIAAVLVALTIHMHRGQDIFHGAESLTGDKP